MKKTDFLILLRKRLEGLPQADIDSSMEYYEELIDDRIEEGIEEEEAVASVGSIEDAAKEILKNIPISTLVKTKSKSKRKLSAAEIILLILGAPLWFPLLVSLFAVVFSLYISLWAIVISLWAVPLSLGVTAIASVFFTLTGSLIGGLWAGMFVFSCGLILAGLCILTFFGCLLLSKGLCKLTAKILLGIKALFIKKEANA